MFLRSFLPFSAIVSAIWLITFFGCASTTQDLLVGIWQPVKPDVIFGASVLEFSKDGTLTVRGERRSETFQYTFVDDTHINISENQRPPMIFQVKVSAEGLTITDDAGHRQQFKKIKE